MTKARAPGKVILFGEHAVVYGRPAIAVPVTDVQAEAHVDWGPPRQGTLIVAPDVGQQFLLREAVRDEPLARVVKLTLKRLGQPPDPDLVITIHSDVPIARGMGSGAAVSTAIVRGSAER